MIMLKRNEKIKSPKNKKYALQIGILNSRTNLLTILQKLFVDGIKRKKTKKTFGKLLKTMKTIQKNINLIRVILFRQVLLVLVMKL